MTGDDVQGSDVDQGLVLTVQGMEVGRGMLPPDYLDDDPEKLADGRHGTAWGAVSVSLR